MGIPWQFSGWDSVLSLSSISGGGTKIPQAVQWGQKKDKKKKRLNYSISPSGDWILMPTVSNQVNVTDLKY